VTLLPTVHRVRRAKVLIALPLVTWCAVVSAQAPEKPMVVPLEEPRIERITSTQYLVTCSSGRKETIVLKGAPESSAAGPKNPYVLTRARQLCWNGKLEAK
jgi:hypothetical protein